MPSDNYPVEVTFTAAAALPRPVHPGALRASNLFQISPNLAAFRRLGVSAAHGVVPWVLHPTNIVYQEVRQRLLGAGLGGGQKKPPYAIEVDGTVAGASLRLRVFPPNIAITSIGLRGLTAHEYELVPQLVAMQRAASEGLVPSLTRWMMSMIGTLNHRSNSDVPTTRMLPAVRIATQLGAAELPGWAERHQQELVAALIRDVDYRASDPTLTGLILGKNLELNRKAGTRQWLDKQGAVVVNDIGDKRDPDFVRVVDLQMFAVGMEAFLDSYETSRGDAPHLFDLVLNRIRPWIEGPDRVFRASVSTREAWKVLRNELALDALLTTMLKDPVVEARMQETRQRMRNVPNEWWTSEDVEEYLTEQAEDVPRSQAASPQIVQIITAAQAQIATGNINNYVNFDDLLDDLAVAVNSVQGVDEGARTEAKTILDKLRATTGTVATAAAGNAGGALLGAALKQILGLP